MLGRKDGFTIVFLEALENEGFKLIAWADIRVCFDIPFVSELSG